MASQLRNMMAEIESWESAAEFGIPQDLWASYQVRHRSDDLYIAVLSSIFDTLRDKNSDIRQQSLSDLAKTLLIYSHSAASKYLSGVDRTINLLYCAATFYLAGLPATATLVTKQINDSSLLSQEEKFLYRLINRSLNREEELENKLTSWLESSNQQYFTDVVVYFKSKEREGLIADPRLFIASKLTIDCLNRFKKFNTWDILRENAANFSPSIWQSFLINSNVFPLWELFPSQMTAISSGILSDANEVYSLQMPTSAGKTSLCEILIYHEVKGRRKKVLFLVPFRALAAEIKEGVSKRLESAGVTVLASHGGNIPTRSESATAESADVLIITPEKFMALAQNTPNLGNSFDTIICDEGHLIDDSSRGLQYELLLTKLKSAEDRPRKMVFISAILPNVDEIHEWLGGSPDKLAKSNYKPVETDFAFITSQGPDIWQLEFNTIYERPRSYFLRSFLIKDDFRYLNTTTNRKKLIGGRDSYTTLACVAALKARRNGPVALFTTQKGKNGVAGLAKKMLELCSLRVAITDNSPALSEALPNLMEYISFQFGNDYSLSQLLRYGIGFHHGNLPQEIRREMEVAIQKGVINILICTSTLAEGVNLPIRTLVIHTIKRFDGDSSRPIERRSIKNIIGRVGRAGKETRGRVIFANDGERSEAENVFKDLQMEPAFGALFNLISSINSIVTANNIQLNNEVFEAQDKSFLSILDKIDTSLIDLMPPELMLEQLDLHIGNILENTLAYRYCDTDTLRNRIKEVFIIRARHIQSTVPKERWGVLKKSGASPRFFQNINNLLLLERSEWQSLIMPDDNTWFEEVIFKLFEASLIDVTTQKDLLKKVILGWMRGFSYAEISNSCHSNIDETLKILSGTIGYELQDAAAKVLQLAIARYGEENLSEIARNWPSLLQYGLYDLQQLDMFDRGASDRLGVWGLSRYIKKNNIFVRGQDLIKFLRGNSEAVKNALYSDSRVPRLSVLRICEELRIK